MTDSMFMFCHAYIEQGFRGGGRAYRKAYPRCKSDKSARVSAARLLAKPYVVAFLAPFHKRLADKAEISIERVLLELARMGYANMDDFSEWGPDGVTLRASKDLPPGLTACVAEVTETKTKDGGSIKFKLHDKPAALRDIAKYLGMFIERHEVSGPEGGPIEITQKERLMNRIDQMIANRVTHASQN